MKIGKKARTVLDVVLTLMIVFEMFIQYTGNFLHEVVGFAFFATVVVHLAFSAAWMKSTASLAKKGKLTGQRIASIIMGCLLAVAMVVLGVSSVAISNVLYDAGFTWPFGAYALWAAIHTMSSYALCALVVVHLGMHWAFFASAFKVPYDPSRRRAISTGVHAVAAVGAVALGVTAARHVMPQALALASSTDETATTASEAASGAEDKSFKNPVSDQSAPSSQNAPSAKSGKSRRDYSQNAPSAGSESAPDSASKNSAPPASTHEEAPSEPSTGEAGPSNDVSSGGEAGAGAADVSGICTLCRKRCPLSDPQCDKPYRAGLL